MSVSNFIEHVRVSSGHISNDSIVFVKLIIYPVNHTFGKYLFVESFGVGSGRFTSGFYAETINVIESIMEWHQHENIWLGTQRVHAYSLRSPKKSSAAPARKLAGV